MNPVFLLVKKESGRTIVVNLSAIAYIETDTKLVCFTNSQFITLSPESYQMLQEKGYIPSHD